MQQPNGADAAIGVAFAILGAIAALFISRTDQPLSLSAQVPAATPAPAIQVPEVSIPEIKIPEIQSFIPPLPNVQLPSLPAQQNAIELPAHSPATPPANLPSINPAEWFKGFSGSSVDLASMSPEELRDRIGARVYYVLSTGCGSFPIAPNKIATAFHCVKGQAENFQTPDGSETFEGQLIWYDQGADAAVFQVNDRTLNPFPLATAVTGEEVWAFGYPITTGQRLTATPSQVTDAAYRDSTMTLSVPVVVLPGGTYAPGNSGGPLLNQRGEVVGFAHAITKAPPHTGFAIPSGVLPR